MTTKRIAKAVVVCMLLCGVVHAQSVTCNVLGTVVDPAGATVPGAEIQIKDRATGAIRTATSGTEAVFRVTNLPPGGFWRAGDMGLEVLQRAQ